MNNASTRLRQRLVRDLESSSTIRSPAVRDAILRVPREVFIPDVVAEQGIAAAYQDEAYPIKTDPQGNAISSSSQPTIMAAMLEELRLEPGHRVLEIGAGSGYNAALLSNIVGKSGRVTSVELDPEIAKSARRSVREVRERATITVGDGRNGFEANAPYDRIVVTASTLDVPRAFFEQLREGGLLVLPLRLTDAVPFRQVVATFVRERHRLTSVSVIHGGFMRVRDRPEDPSLPWPESRVVERRDGTERLLASLSGSTWGRLTEAARRDLLSLTLSRPRSRPIGMRVAGARLWDFEAFVVLAAPEESLVGWTREGLNGLLFYNTAIPAVMDTDHLGLAHPAGKQTVTRIDAYGHDGAERLLAELVEDWERRGRPGTDRLGIDVTHGRSRRTWRTKRRGSSRLSFEYR